MDVGGLAGPGSGADETALAQRAAAGDGEAFATLYERYEGRTYNLCYRILGSQDDAADATQEAFLGVLRRLPKLEGRDVAFGSYVFTSARNACYDLIERRKRTQPSDEIPEYATPMGGGVGGGGTGFDPGDPEDDPERNVLLEARTEEIRTANLALPERQREVLALREVEELSYDEIAEIMDMNRNSVAQLISRARINLRDALRGTALASIATTSPECERALPLIALLQDGQLDESSGDAEWLGDHLISCDTCRLGREAMEEAGVSYRAWVPVAAAPFLFRETMAHAAELVGADWSETIAKRESARAAAGAGGAVSAGAGAAPARARVLRHRRRDLTLIGLLACLLLLVFLVGAASDDAPAPEVVPAAEEEAIAAEEPETEAEEPKKEPAEKKKPKKKDGGEPTAAAPADEPDEDESPTDEAASAPSEPRAAPRANDPEQRTRVRDRGDSGGRDGLTPQDPPPDTTPDPPPDTTPDPPPPPPEEPCIDPTTGRPCGEPPPCSGVNCPRQPPPSCVPGTPNCPRPPRF